MVPIAPVVTEQVDARHLLCPMPVIRMQQKVLGQRPGTLIEVVCTDPGALQDIPAWCRVHGHDLVDVRVTDDDIYIVVRVGGSED